MEDPTEVRITLRLPTALRDRLISAAQESARSMNGEIVHRVESFDALKEELSTAKEMYLKNVKMIEDLRAKVVGDTELRIDIRQQLVVAQDKIQHLEEVKERLERTLEEIERQKEEEVPVEERALYVLLDADGIPVSWPEVLAQVEAISRAAGSGIQSIQVGILNPEIVGSENRRDKWRKLIRLFKKRRQSRRKGVSD